MPIMLVVGEVAISPVDLVVKNFPYPPRAYSEPRYVPMFVPGKSEVGPWSDGEAILKGAFQRKVITLASFRNELSVPNNVSFR